MTAVKQAEERLLSMWSHNGTQTYQQRQIVDALGALIDAKIAEAMQRGCAHAKL